ncbi:putative ribonuclease H protein [Sesbania bispinosa]|nr:putative ribonuclease H protein [Sesbania bispinosa]
MSVRTWIFEGVKENHMMFLAALWGIWKRRNRFIFDCKETPLWEVAYGIISLTTVMGKCYSSTDIAREPRHVRWEEPTLDQVALNVDGSVMGDYAGFRGLLRNNSGGWLGGFYGTLKKGMFCWLNWWLSQEA